MCNLYSITEGPQAIRDLARAMRSAASFPTTRTSDDLGAGRGAEAD
jgi:hypothetical protein